MNVGLLLSRDLVFIVTFRKDSHTHTKQMLKKRDASLLAMAKHEPHSPEFLVAEENQTLPTCCASRGTI